MKRSLITALVLLGLAPVTAANWEDYGMKVVNSTQEEDKISMELTDTEGKFLTVNATGQVPDKSLAIIANLQKSLSAWKSMQIKSIRYTLLENNIVEVQVFPSAFADENVDFMKHVPGHLFFIYKDQLQYSFRLEVNKLFVKIKGYYIDEADLLKKLKQAIKDPQGFIIKRDPEYFIGKLEKLEEELERLKGKAHLQELELARIKSVTAALHNTGVFSGPEKISENLILRVVELRTQYPIWKREQIQEQLERDKVEWNKKQVKLILSVYFSEFE